MRAVASVLCTIGCLVGSTNAGTVTFEPSSVLVAPGETADFVVSISETNLMSFTSFDLLFSSDTAGLNLSFEFAADFTSSFPVADPVSYGAFATDLLIGGFNGEYWQAPLVLGTLHIDTTGMDSGIYEALVQVRPDAEQETIGLISGVADGTTLVPEGISGSASLTITDPATDADGDGVSDASDAFPNDPSESVDTDADGTGDNADTDDDGDGVADESDAFPLDPAEVADADGDMVGDNADAFPNDPTETVDTDADGAGDNADTDDDNDGVPDEEDAFPLDPARSTDNGDSGTDTSPPSSTGPGVMCGVGMLGAMFCTVLGMTAMRRRRNGLDARRR